MIYANGSQTFSRGASWKFKNTCDALLRYKLAQTSNSIRFCCGIWLIWGRRLIFEINSLKHVCFAQLRGLSRFLIKSLTNLRLKTFCIDNNIINTAISD